MKSKVVYKTDAEKGGTGKADAEEDGTGRGSEGRGQSNFELSAHKVSLRFPLPVPSSSAGFWLRPDATVVCSFKVIVSVECCTFFNLR